MRDGAPRAKGKKCILTGYTDEINSAIIATIVRYLSCHIGFYEVVEDTLFEAFLAAWSAP
jgi:hypothetical protein